MAPSHREEVAADCVEEVMQTPRGVSDVGERTMPAPQEVQRMLALSALGWGARRVSRELGCGRHTLRQYLRRGGWRPMDVSGREGSLEPHREWLAERLLRRLLCASR